MATTANKPKSSVGRWFREGVTLREAVRLFDDEHRATQIEEMFVSERWPTGIECPFCGSGRVAVSASRNPQPYRCKNRKVCGRWFSVKTGTVMHSSKLGLGVWGLAIYILTTSLKGCSSMKLHRDLGVAYTTAWHLSHRIRQSWDNTPVTSFKGIVEVDETYIGGRERNKHTSKKQRLGRGIVGKTAVVGAKERETGQILTKPIPDTTRQTLHDFIKTNTYNSATIYTDDHRGYTNLPRAHHTIKHSKG